MGGFQRFHLHVIVYHQKLVLQIGPGKGAALHLGDTAVFQIVTQHLLHHHTDAAFSLAAVAFEQHHGLPAVGGDEAVAEILLQGQNVLILQKLRQKMQPCHRLRSVGIIFDGQAVAAELLLIGELTVQKQRTVGNMEPIFVYRKIGYIGFQLHHFKKSRCTFGKAAVEIGTEHFVDILAYTFFVSDTAILSKETAAHPHHRVLLQKVLAEPDLIYHFTVVPKGPFAGVFMFVHSIPP